MGGEWLTVPLADLTEADTPVTYGVVKPGPEDHEGVLFIRGGDIADGRVLTDQLRTITREVSEQYRRTQLRGGEIVISLVGNPGQVAIVPESLKGANIARQAGLVRLRDDVDTRFVKYFLSSSLGQEALGAHALGSVQQVINLRDLKTLRVPLPPLPEQRAIAHILGTLDDKIELNRRMNETLEAMARAIFKSWFVDFDPVRAKAEGRDPGLPQHIADLFPDSFEDSELGEIPAGWLVKSLGDVLELSYGKALKADNRNPGKIPVYGSNGPVGWHDEHLVKGPGIVVGRKGNPGITTWVPSDFYPIDTTFFVIPALESPCLHFLFHALRWQDLASLGADSAVPGLNRNIAYMNTQLVPSLEVVERFEEIASSLSVRVEHSNSQTNTLAALRDTLLPKLISGELRVPDAEKLVEAAV